MSEYRPITDAALAIVREALREADEHEHPPPHGNEDLFCLNHRCWLGERMGWVLARLDLAEAALNAELAARCTDQRHSAQPGTDTANTTGQKP